MGNGQKNGILYRFNNVNRAVIALVHDSMFWIKCGAAAFKTGEYNWSNFAVLIAEKPTLTELVIMKPSDALGVYSLYVKGLPARIVTVSMYVEFVEQSIRQTILVLFDKETGVWYPKGFMISTSVGEEKFVLM